MAIDSKPISSTRLVIHWCTAAILGALAAGIILNSKVDTSDQSKATAELKQKVDALELLLQQKNRDLINTKLSNLAKQSKDPAAQEKSLREICEIEKAQVSTTELLDGAMLNQPSVNNFDLVKQLATSSALDSRTFSEKASELMDKNTSRENVAIVSKSLLDLSADPERLSDAELQSFYAKQTDPDVKRVAAQTLALRGNSALLENYIADSQRSLKNENPLERQQALQNLAKTHSAVAVNAIAPLLHDSDINVKLDALLALGATGNQTHLRLIEDMVKDPDPAVSTLAKDVVQNLRGLSDYARTNITIPDVASEIPAI